MACLMTGCSASPASGPSGANPTDVADLSKAYFREVRWRLPEGGAEQFEYMLDRPNFVRQHRDEMLKTLEVVDTVQTQNIAVGFVRYSIGATTYHDSVWMRKIDGQWRPAWNQYFSEYADDPFGDLKPDDANALIKRVSDGEKEAPKAWW